MRCSLKPFTHGMTFALVITIIKPFHFSWRLCMKKIFGLLVCAACFSVCATPVTITSGCPTEKHWNLESIYHDHFSIGCGNDVAPGKGKISVPEPSSFSMIMVGLMSLAGFAISRKRK
jgi:hypothetical protein